jgi:predicted negative regulator of RcsB-dependent stress response
MAKRRPISRRSADHSKALEPDDAFVTRLVEFSTWARSNRQTLIIFGVVLVTLIGGIVYYVRFSATLEEQAAVEIERIEQQMQAGDVATARSQLSQFLDRYGGTDSAAEARLILAQLHLTSGQVQEALSVLEGSDTSVRNPLGLQLEVLRAKTFEAAGRPTDAERAYLRAADAADLQFVRVDALADAARIRMSLGNPAGAADLYERILSDLPEGHPDRGVYQMRLAEAEVQAG